MYSIKPFSYHFSKDGLKKVYSQEDITINQGDCVLVTGSSGRGKSTLLKILKGIIPEYSPQQLTGEVLYNGIPLGGAQFKKNQRDILFLFQNPFSQVIHSEVPEEFFFTMENFNFTKNQMQDQKEQLAPIFGLNKIWSRQTTELSNGECQKLVLASLLAVNPKVLLFDEPTAFLDPQARSEFYDWLASVKGQLTLVIVDHHLKEIAPLVDYALKIEEDGRVKRIAIESLTDEPKEQISPFKSLDELLPKAERLSLLVKNLSFKHKGADYLLDNANFETYSGQVTVIKGSNGVGKSTFFKLIAGLLKPEIGEIELKSNNKPLSKRKGQSKIAFIFQNPESHFFYDTIEQELGEKFQDKNVQKILGLFFSEIRTDRSPFLLSEGEKRRLSILMALIQGKQIFLFDEPTFGQDSRSRYLIAELVLALKKCGAMQLIISHDREFISRVADRVYQIKNKTLESLK